MEEKISISLIIPVCNESDKAPLFINNIYKILKKKKFLDFEIIIIDDGSTNNTYLNIKKKIIKKNILIIKNKKNYGIGYSIKKGITKSKKKYVIWSGADNDTNIYNYIKYYKKLKKYDLLIFFIKNTNVRQFARSFFSDIFTKILNLTFLLKLPYYNGIFFMEKKKIKNLNFQSKRFFFGAEIKLLSLKKKYKYITIPIKLKKSTIPNIKTVLNFKNWLDVIYNYLRLIYLYYFKIYLK